MTAIIEQLLAEIEKRAKPCERNAVHAADLIRSQADVPKLIAALRRALGYIEYIAIAGENGTDNSAQIAIKEINEILAGGVE